MQRVREGVREGSGLASSGGVSPSKWAEGCFLLPTFRELRCFYSLPPPCSSPCPHLPLFYLCFYLSALSISSICTIITAPSQRELGWCLSDSNNQGCSWARLLSRGEFTQVRGATTAAPQPQDRKPELTFVQIGKNAMRRRLSGRAGCSLAGRTGTTRLGVLLLLDPL